MYSAWPINYPRASGRKDLEDGLPRLLRIGTASQATRQIPCTEEPILAIDIVGIFCIQVILLVLDELGG